MATLNLVLMLRRRGKSGTRILRAARISFDPMAGLTVIDYKTDLAETIPLKSIEFLSIISAGGHPRPQFGM
jgi:hypothetical protein